MIQRWDYSAYNMLYHYRCVLNGYAPFSSAKKNPELLRQRDNLHDKAMEFIADAHRLVHEMGKMSCSQS